MFELFIPGIYLMEFKKRSECLISLNVLFLFIEAAHAAGH